MKYSYVTVLSTETYLLGVLCMYKSLKNSNTKIPLTVVVTDNISEDIIKILENEDINVIRKPKIKFSNIINDKNKDSKFMYWNNTFDKLYVFELTQFEKIVYIDSDMLILKNIDELFKKINLSAVVAGNFYPGNEEWVKLNSGLMVIEPKSGILNEFEKILNVEILKGKVIGDQNIIQEYIPEWENIKELHLDHKYNMFFQYLEYYIDKLKKSLDDISIIHFISKDKPWMLDVTQKERLIGQYKEGSASRIVLEKYFGILDSLKIF